MKRFLLVGASLAALSVAAQAADLPSRVAQPVAPIMAPAFIWTGLYVGVNAGYAFSSNNNAEINGNPAALAFIGTGTLPRGFSSKQNGFTGGAQIGYNYQIGQFVIGAETDISYLGTKNTATVLLPSGTYGSFKQEGNYLGTLRARLGFTPVDRLLVYGTGGLAYGNTSVSGAVTAPALLGAPAWAGSKDETKVGWTIGAGVEYAFTNNLTGKLEYLYYDLGKTTSALTSLNAPAVGTGVFPNARVENTGQLVRAGLNYKF